MTFNSFDEFNSLSTIFQTKIPRKRPQLVLMSVPAQQMNIRDI